MRRCRTLAWYTVAAGTGEGGSHSDEVCRPGQARRVKGKDKDWCACEGMTDVLAYAFRSRNESSGAAKKKYLLHGTRSIMGTYRLWTGQPAGVECALLSSPLLSLGISEQ